MKTAKLSSEQKIKWTSLILRVGLAAVFLYAAIDALVAPDAWISFVPNFISHFMSLTLALKLISLSQIVLAGWLLSGKYVVYAAGLVVLLLVGIVIFNSGSFLITFRDIGLIAAAVAVGILER